MNARSYLASRLLVSIALLVVTVLSGAWPSAAQSQQAPLASTPEAPHRAQVTDALRSSPVTFIENVGQFADDTRFQVRGGMGAMWLADDAIWITRVEHSRADASEGPKAQSAQVEPQDTPLHGVNLKLSFPGANPSPRIEPLDRLDTTVSYFIGADPDGWHPDVPVWGGVRYVNLYPGIDLELTSSQLQPRMIARPGADLSAVRLRVEGADAVAVDGSDHLRLSTAIGDFTMPLLQLVTTESSPVPAPRAKPELRRSDVTFPFASTGATTRPSSSIRRADDTNDLIYSTFLGGNDGDHGESIAVDGSGATYVVGHTESSDFPTTAGSFEPTYSEYKDVFVTKLNPAGSALVYSTFLGGNSDAWGRGITVDDSGAAYVTGSTYFDFPTTPDTFDTTHNGGVDAFVVKLDASGSSLVYGTFLGGSGSDDGYDIAVDATGSAHVTGRTSSSSFPTTPGALDTSYNEGGDAFVVELDASGSSLVYGTLLGGSDDDEGRGIAVDGSGAAYVVGEVASDDYPTTAGALDTTLDGSSDSFVSKLNAAGSALVFSTFLGGSDWDSGADIALNELGEAYVTGRTGSDDYPVTAGAFETSYNGGTSDAFVTKLSATGTDLVYSTFLGGADDNDQGEGIAVDGDGVAYVTGGTDSSDFPTTPDALDTTLSDPTCPWYAVCRDVFATKLNGTGTGLVYSTFLGGSEDDVGEGIVVDDSGAFYITGQTNSSADFPTTPGAFDPTDNPNTEAFVARFAGGEVVNNPPDAPSNPSPADGATGVSIDADLSWTGGDPDPGDLVTYDVYFEADDSTPDDLLCDDVDTPACAPGTLDYSTQYFWYVVASDDHGASTTGDIWDFTTVAAPGPKTWDGSVSSDWHTAANWTPNGVPTSSDDVTIPDVGNDPVVSSGDAQVDSLTLNSGAGLDLADRTLTVEGTLTNNGTLKQTLGLAEVSSTRFLRITNLAGTQTKYYGVDMTSSSIPSTARLAKPTVSSTVGIRRRLEPYKTPDSGAPPSDGRLLLEAPATYAVDGPATRTAHQGTLYAIADATVLEGYPSSNFGATEDMWAGYDEILDPPGQTARSLVQFDMASLPSEQEITEATLRLYLVSSWDYPDTSRTITTYRATSTWAEDSVTWNSQPGSQGAYGSNSIVSGAWGWYEFDVTDLVSAWVEGTYDNHGIIVRGPEVSGEDASWRAFGTKESDYVPELIVDYSGPNTSPNAPSAPSPANGATEVSTDADLSWTGGDPNEGDSVIYDVYLGSSSPPPLVATIGPYSATQTSLTYDPGMLSQGTQYAWYVVATDDHGASATSDTWTFITAGVADTEVTVSVSGNQFCADRTTGVKRCFDIETDAQMDATVRFYFSEAERNAMSLEDLLVYHYTDQWTEEPGPYVRGGAGDAQYVEAQNVDSFSLFALDSAGGGFVYLPLVLRRYPPIPDVPVLNVISNPDGDGSYTVSWKTASLADEYVLEEDGNRGFSSPTERYSGPGLTWDATGKAPGTYHYRVKARNAYGDSGWSNIESVAVAMPELEPCPADTIEYLGTTNQNRPVKICADQDFSTIKRVMINYSISCSTPDYGAATVWDVPSSDGWPIEDRAFFVEAQYMFDLDGTFAPGFASVSGTWQGIEARCSGFPGPCWEVCRGPVGQWSATRQP